jgi:hypothetical protein
MIVTKEMAASLARDTSHSRPHRVADANDYDVFGGSLKSAEKLEGLMDNAVGNTGPAFVAPTPGCWASYVRLRSTSASRPLHI